MPTTERLKGGCGPVKVRRPHEPVRVVQKRYGYSPQVFLWHGRAYRAIKIEDSWTVSRRGPFNRLERLYFRIRCAEGVFDLFQDVLSNTWYVERFRGRAEVLAKSGWASCSQKGGGLLSW